MPTSPTGCATPARRAATARTRPRAAATAGARCSARRSVVTAARAAARTRASNSGAAPRASNIVPFRALNAHTTEHQRAHDPAARPQRTPDEEGARQIARAQGVAPAAGRVHARLHPHAEEAELGAAQGG